MRVVIGVLIFTAVFVFLERVGPVHREQPRWRADSKLDLGWLAVTILTNRTLVPIAVFVAAGSLALASGRPLAGWFEGLPTVAQVAIVLVVGDFVGYWLHRLHHRVPFLWKVHAVHHSSEQLDWLSSVRVHPLNSVFQTVTRAAILYAVGVSPGVLAGYVPFLTFYAFLLHANVRWRFGPVGWLIASPAWHRWHHAADVIGEGRNFGGLFTTWDYVFRTARFPQQLPTGYGLREDQLPPGLTGQLLYPFRGPFGNAG